MGENPARVSIFLSRFINARGNYPAADFQTLGWVSILKLQWWSSLTLYALDVFADDLM